MELPRRVVWLGDSRKNLQAFPQRVRRDMGAALFVAQRGETAEHVKPYKGVGSGVMEIAERYATNAYRLIYAVQLSKSATKRRGRERKMSTKPEVTEGDGNIFADLGIDNADEFYTRACLGVQVMKLLKGRSQKEAAKLLGVKQPEISALMRAKFSRFSQERLIGFLNKLDRKVTIQISRHRGKEPYQQVTLAP